MDNLDAKERIEIDYWKDSREENPEADSLHAIITKFSEARVLLPKLRRYQAEFARAGTILELGAGQGWASCIVKRQFPNSRVIATDISPHAVESVHKWEYLLKVRLDEALACRSYEIPMPDASVDLVWCFEAAHHFIAHRRTLVELHRVLRPGGSALYLHEPSCRPVIYRMAHRRVNQKRPEVPEDVLRYHEIAGLARAAGFTVDMRQDPTPVNRSPFETVYYMALQRSRILRSLLPCSMDYLFRKPAV